MMEIHIAAIVEGHGECEAVPELLRRIAQEFNPALRVKVDPILRVPSSLLRKKDELERSVELAARKLSGLGGILVLIDCDWDVQACPKYDGPGLLKRAQKTRSDLPISVVLAYREYETWFIAAAESLRGKRGLPNNLMADPNPENIRGAKEWLTEKKGKSNPYTEIIDQVAYTKIFDLNAARNAGSFDKCYREVIRLFNLLKKESMDQ